MKPLVILGAGGYAQELLWLVDDVNNLQPTWDFLGFVDPGAPEKRGLSLYDRPILGGFEDSRHLPAGVSFACGIGAPASRRRECREAERRGWMPASLIHPTVIAAKHVEIGPGVVVGAGSVLAPYARLGRHCAINVQATVGHNSVLEDYVVVCPGAKISGNAVIGSEAYIGSNACVFPGKLMGPQSKLAANSSLITDLAAGRTAAGVPARAFDPPAASRSRPVFITGFQTYGPDNV